MSYLANEHHFPASITRCDLQDNILTVYCLDNTGAPLAFSIAFYEPAMLRLRVWKDAYTPPAFPVVDEALLCPEAVKLETDESRYCVAFGGYRLEMKKAPFGIRVLDAGGQVVWNQNMRDVDSVGEGLNQVPPLGYSLDADGGLAGTNLGMTLRYNEHIYGLGQRFTSFDKVGQRVSMRNFDTLTPTENEYADKHCPTAGAYTRAGAAAGPAGCHTPKRAKAQAVGQP